MATLGAAIRDIMLSSPPLYALVVEKISPLKVSQSDDYPAISYQVITGDQQICKSGGTQATMQVSAFARTYEVVHAVKDAVKGALDNFQGERKGIGLSINKGTTRDLFPEDAQLFQVVIEYEIYIS